MVNREKTNEILFAKEKLVCSKAEYHTEVRDALLDYHLRVADLGWGEHSKHCLKELKRLDREHGVPQAHIDQGRGPVAESLHRATDGFPS